MPTRRSFLLALAASPVALVFLRPVALAATPECADADDFTPAETSGPFFKPRSPERGMLREKGIPGTPLDVSGRVFGRDCKPLAGALLDFWQADGEGEYDNDGFRLRGHQYADARGGFRLSTVVPGLYPGRTRHIHVRVQPKGGRILTTQLYVPGEAQNKHDSLFRSELLMKFDATKQSARFDFVLDTI